VDRLAGEVLDRALTLAGGDSGLLCLAGPGGAPITLARYRGFAREAVRDTIGSPGFGALLASPPEGLAGEGSSLELLAAEADAPLVVVRAAPSEGDATGILVVACAPPLESRMRLLRAYAADASLALANATLHRSILNRERELGTIVDSVPLPIVLLDGDARFRAINPAAAELFRLTPEFEAGQSVRGKLAPQIEQLLESAEETIAREVVVTVGGIPRAYRASVTVVRDGSEAGARVLVLYDITSERELEQRKADFLAVIGHELRTPLTAIRGFTLTVLRNGDQLDAPTRTESLQRVLVQAERLERLIEDLLFVSRVEQHRPPLHFAWDDAVAVTAAVLEEFRRRSPERTLLMDAWTAEMPVRMDRVKVEQVLYHLIDNALKYSEPDTDVRVSLTQSQAEIEVAVIDRGIGIYSGDVPRLFRAFGQLDTSSTRKQGGTGVGLHVAKTLVDTFGGRIWVESVLGKGSTFTFAIPRVPPAGDDWSA
jgi:signal transduction histidine kinase